MVHDYAIVRQPESNKLVGISLTKHGKREWVYPPFDETVSSQAARQAMQINRNPTTNLREAELKQRIWDDLLVGLKESIDYETRMEQKAIEDFESNINLFIAMGAGDGDMVGAAIRGPVPPRPCPSPALVPPNRGAGSSIHPRSL